MPEFRYQALDAKGRKSEGVSSATDVKELTEVLRQQGFFLVQARPVREDPVSPAAAPAAAFSHPELPVAAGAKDHPVRQEHVAQFAKQLSIMVRTALPIVESVQSLGRQQADPVFKSVLLEVARSVQHGLPLSHACARFPNAFDEVFVSLLAAGEATGSMPPMLERIYRHLEFQIGLRARVRSALLYPTVVVCVAFAVVAFLVLFILPTFAEVFSQFEMELPLSTRVLLGISAHLRSAWYLYGIAALCSWGYAAHWVNAAANVRSVHELQLSLPVTGRLTRNIVLTRVLRTLSALVAAGVPILKALDLAKSAAGNIVFREVLSSVEKAASEGRGLSSALAASRIFPEMVANMVANAEKTGTLPEALERLAEYYEHQTDEAIKDLFSFLEPVLVVGLGLIVAGIAVSVLLPIFSLGNSVQ